jgi:hypothetical protein
MKNGKPAAAVARKPVRTFIRCWANEAGLVVVLVYATQYKLLCTMPPEIWVQQEMGWLVVPANPRTS